jgi:hypothetical protein
MPSCCPLRVDPVSASVRLVLESCNSALRNASGSSRPRFSARRKIPAAALGLKKNLSGTRSSSTSANDVNAPPPLGHSEVTAVQHSPGEVVKPDVGQRTENNCEISSTVGTEQAGDVLNDNPACRSNKVVGNAGELEEESRSLSLEACAASGDGEVLAGESSAEKVDGMNMSSGLIPDPPLPLWPFSVAARVGT